MTSGGVMLDLDALEATAKAATPGEWKRLERWDGRVVVQSAGDGLTIGRFQILPDIEYITALSPTVALALIAELRAARVAREVLVEWEQIRLAGGYVCMFCGEETDHFRCALARALGREGR